MALCVCVHVYTTQRTKQEKELKEYRGKEYNYKQGGQEKLH